MNADAAAGAVAAALGAYKVLFLTDVEGWLADPADPGSRISQATATEVRDSWPASAAGCGPSSRPAWTRSTAGWQRAHRGRAHAPLAAARAVHRRGHRHQAVALAELQALERDAVMATYARNPVEFVRGEGTRLWDDEGNEYLDFLAGISVVQVGPLPTRAGGGGERAGGAADARGQPLLHGARRCGLPSGWPTARSAGRVFFCNSGAEAIECALKLAPQAPAAAGEVVVLEGGFHGRTYGALSATPQESKQEPFAPLVPGFTVVPRDDPAALAAAVGRDTAAVLIEPIQGESGIHPMSDEMLEAAPRARATRTARC